MRVTAHSSDRAKGTIMKACIIKRPVFNQQSDMTRERWLINWESYKGLLCILISWSKYKGLSYDIQYVKTPLPAL